MVAPTGPANGQSNITSSGDKPPKKGDANKLSVTGVGGSGDSPQTQGAAAPDPTQNRRIAILHMAHNLFEPDPLPRANRGRELMAGAYYLAEQQANRQNNEPPKPLRDNVFVHAEAASSMEGAAAVVHGSLIPAEPTARAILTTITEAHNHVTAAPAVPAVQAAAPEPQQAPQGAQGGEAQPPQPVIPSAVDWANYSRIYIPGHGAAGYGLLKQANERFTAAQVAQMLIDSGALQHVKDIRITSSGSSEATWQGELPAPHQPDTERADGGGWLPFVDGLSGAAVSTLVSFGRGLFNMWGAAADGAVNDVLEGPHRNTNEAFAQAVSRELARLGHPDVTVSGYAGAEMPLRDAGLDHHERRMDPLAAAAQAPIFQRRSEVRTQYRGGIIFRQPDGQLPLDQLGAAAEQDDDDQ